MVIVTVPGLSIRMYVPTKPFCASVQLVPDFSPEDFIARSQALMRWACAMLTTKRTTAHVMTHRIMIQLQSFSRQTIGRSTPHMPRAGSVLLRRLRPTEVRG